MLSFGTLTFLKVLAIIIAIYFSQSCLEVLFMRTNFHTHTYRCGHANGTEEDYIKEAIAKDVKILGMSDHGPFKDGRFGPRMGYKEKADYLSVLTELKARYEAQLKLYSGFELEFDPKEAAHYEDLLASPEVDYLLFGQHFFVDPYGVTHDTYDLAHTSLFIDYAKTVAEGIATGYFAFLAHPDVFMYNNLAWDNNCDRACDILFDAAIKYGFPFELNANGMRRGKYPFVDGTRYQYPDVRFWRKVADARIPVLVSSDCHNPLHMWDRAMEEAHTLANELGLQVIESPFK